MSKNTNKVSSEVSGSDAIPEAAPGSKTAFIALGSNVGDRAANIAGALEAFPAAGIRVIKTSSLYETEPWDAPPQSWFLNAVAQVETALMPRQLLRALLRIERVFGRRRGPIARAPRTLDLDILLYGSSVVRTKEIEIPHPRMALRRFVLVPLAELAPALRHPILHKSISALLADTPDRSQVRLWRATIHHKPTAIVNEDESEK